MKLNALAKTMAATAVVLIIAGCGGGSGDAPVPITPPPTTPNPSLQVSGTAATGAALAAAAVQVKCATGSGSATTDASGAYTVTLDGGALPCMIEVRGTASGVEVTLHSVTEAGTANAASNQTAAVANVTPLTEIVVAQLTGALPSEAFTKFDATSSGQITTDKLASATTTVLTTLKTATGLDFAAIDPFKANLVAATSSAPAQGNAYDKLLDQLGDKVAPAALPQIVTQVAAAASSGDSAGLQDAMASVDAGSLPNCPAVLSGKYRVLEYFGASYVRELNFKAMTISHTDGSGTLPITVDAAKPCEFTVAGMAGTNQVKIDYAMGASGVGAARIQNLTANRRNIAYLFPVQSHTQAELVGNWTYQQGGYMPNEGLVHMAGKVDVAADGKVVPCDYDLSASTWSTCTVDAEANLTLAARADGGFDLKNGSTVAGSVWGYRAPNGTLTVFGTTTEAGSTDPAVEQMALVLFKPQAQVLPAVGTTTNYWDVSLTRVPGAGLGQNNVDLVADTTTILSVDSGANSVVRKRASDGREDTVQYNVPVTGVRHRAQTPTITGVFQFPIPGTGIVISVNSVAGGTHLYNVSIARQ